MTTSVAAAAAVAPPPDREQIFLFSLPKELVISVVVAALVETVLNLLIIGNVQCWSLLRAVRCLILTDASDRHGDRLESIHGAGRELPRWRARLHQDPRWNRTSRLSCRARLTLIFTPSRKTLIAHPLQVPVYLLWILLPLRERCVDSECSASICAGICVVSGPAAADSRSNCIRGRMASKEDRAHVLSHVRLPTTSFALRAASLQRLHCNSSLPHLPLPYCEARSLAAGLRVLQSCRLREGAYRIQAAVAELDMW